MLQTISVIVSGKVQGVFYRQSTKEKAGSLGLTGFVKNCADGKVQIIATGTKQSLEDLVSWCKQGPPRAEVSGIEVVVLPLQSFSGFSIQRL
jgi:acylphosphatase